MAKTSTNISLDPELKRSSQELFADLGIDFVHGDHPLPEAVPSRAGPAFRRHPGKSQRGDGCSSE